MLPHLLLTPCPPPRASTRTDALGCLLYVSLYGACALLAPLCPPALLSDDLFKHRLREAKRRVWGPGWLARKRMHWPESIHHADPPQSSPSSFLSRPRLSSPRTPASPRLPHPNMSGICERRLQEERKQWRKVSCPRCFAVASFRLTVLVPLFTRTTPTASLRSRRRIRMARWI